MHTLPAHLGSIASLASKNPDARYSVVKFEADSKSYKVSATNGHTLAIAKGVINDTDDEKGLLPEDPKEPKATALIPAEFWGSFFRRAKKITSRLQRSSFYRNAVEISTTEERVTMSFGRPYESQTDTVNLSKKRYPDVDSVVPSGKPTLKVLLNAKSLITLLRASLPFMDDERHKVTLSFSGDNSCVKIEVHSPHDGHSFVGVIATLND